MANAEKPGWSSSGGSITATHAIIGGEIISLSPPPDVVEAARRTMNRFGELDGEAWKDVQAVCEWVLSHKAIDK